MTDSVSGLVRLVVVSDRKVEGIADVLRNNGIFPAVRKITPPDAKGLPLSEVLVDRPALEDAVKIIESSGVFSENQAARKGGVVGTILIPVDFSQLSILACRIGFELAARLNLHPVLIHAYAGPFFTPALQFDGDLDFNDVAAGEMADAESTEIVGNETEKLMRKFRRSVMSLQESGKLRKVKFSTTLAPGVPEDVIAEYCRLSAPAMVVMATRHRDRKRQDMIGSVTVEVLDTTRVPVFAIPENYDFPGLPNITRLLMFCNLDRQDAEMVELLMRMFSYPEVEITLVPANMKDSGDSAKLESLCNYLADLYPTAVFKYRCLENTSTREDLESFAKAEGIEMVIVPNKKANIFSRLFKPGIAHKILFDSDVPLFALPV